MVSGRACFCCELGETARLRSFMPWVVFRFLRHGMDGAGCVFAGLGGWRQRVVVLVFIGPLIPCPLGRGNMCGLRASAPPAVRGSGVSSRFPISRGSSSCNLAARCHRLSLLASPFCSRRLVIASALPLASVPAPVFSCCLLSFPSPFLRLAGRGVLCLLAYVLWLSFLSPCSPSRLVPPMRLLACPRRSFHLSPFPSASLSSSHAAIPSRPSSCSCLIVHSVRSFVLPVLRQAWAGSVAARSCLLVPSFSSCGRRLVSAG